MDSLKIRLKNFSIRSDRDSTKPNLSPDEYRALKTIRSNNEVVLQRPDKGGGVVIMNKCDYEEKLLTLISDPSKFTSTGDKQSETVKSRLNAIASKYKISNPTIYKKVKTEGNFPPGHLYGLPKIHKNAENPPLRPIISMSGTVTHELAQHLNEIIKPYIDQSYMLKSTDEFLLAIENLKLNANQSIVSLDVESLFSNVPVEPTIDIILARAYNHDSIPPPDIQCTDLRELLKISTQQTPFAFKGKNYLQTDGVSMGSPLGPTFANFYMADLESSLLSQDKISNPVKYFRYVDDIFAIFNSPIHVRYFIQRLKNRSVLNFTHEAMVNNKFNFLDVQMSVKTDGSLETSVYIKPTDKGIYPNFNSHIPAQYKKSVINSLVNRAIKFSSTEQIRGAELSRIKQVLANNGYPQVLTDRIIQRKLGGNQDNNLGQLDADPVKFFVQFFNLSNFENDRRKLNNIVSAHVKPTDQQAQITVVPYYKPNKLSAQFSTRVREENIKRVNVVYRFNCKEDACNASYIGYTAQKLENRVKQHRYKSSSICKHFMYEHDELPPPISNFVDCFEILFASEDVRSLKIFEAILIKSEKPIINVKYNELYDFLQLF